MLFTFLLKYHHLEPKDEYYLASEYAKNGNLRTYLHENFENLNWNVKINMGKVIARGLSYIHEANIVRRDLVRNHCVN